MAFDPRAVQIHTDGSAYRNPGHVSGCAVVVRYPEHLNREDEVIVDFGCRQAIARSNAAMVSRLASFRSSAHPTTFREKAWRIASRAGDGKSDGYRISTGDGQTVHGLVGQEKVSWFLPILLPIDPNFRVHHADQQVHCPFEGLPQYRTQRRSLRRIVIRSRPSRIESLGSRWMGIQWK
jgi:hypothetical protein